MGAARQWTEEQFTKRIRVTRETFEFILETVTDDIAKETTKFKGPTSPQCQLVLTLYRLAHGCSYTTVGDLFGVAPSTACTIFELFFCKKVIPLSRHVGYVMDGSVSGSVRDVCMPHQSDWIYYLTPIKFPFVKVNGMWEDLIPIQLRTAIFILL